MPPRNDTIHSKLGTFQVSASNTLGNVNWTKAVWATSRYGIILHTYWLRESKFEPKSDLCYFIRYTRALRGSYFYYPKEQRVSVSTKAKYLEDDKKLSSISFEKVEFKVRELNSSNFRSNRSVKWYTFSARWSEPHRSGRVSSVLER